MSDNQDDTQPIPLVTRKRASNLWKKLTLTLVSAALAAIFAAGQDQCLCFIAQLLGEPSEACPVAK